MGKVKDERLFLLIKNFLLVYLPVQRNVSEHTVDTYRTALNQLLKSIAESKNLPVTAVTFDMINRGTVTMYLDSLTEKKGFSSSTRNNRLAAIRAFVNYAAACKPEYISLSGELDAIKIQKSDRFAKVDYMSEKAVEAFLQVPDVKTKKGRRDQMLLILLYDTGARISELLGIRLCDLKLDKTPTVRLYGKGRKIRTVPLMGHTVEHLKCYMSEFHKECSMLSEEYLFYVERHGRRNPMCDDTVRLFMNQYAAKAREFCPDVPEHVHPHLWRHTRAMHLYQHGMDLTLISQWLGHSQLETTLVYAHADAESKRQAIEKAMGTGGACSVNAEKYTVDDEEILKRLYGL